MELSLKIEGPRREQGKTRAGPSGQTVSPEGVKSMKSVKKVCKNSVRPSKSARRYAISAFHDAKVPESIVFFEKQWKSAIRYAKRGAGRSIGVHRG